MQRPPSGGGARPGDAAPGQASGSRDGDDGASHSAKREFLARFGERLAKKLAPNHPDGTAVTLAIQATIDSCLRDGDASRPFPAPVDEAQLSLTFSHRCRCELLAQSFVLRPRG